MKRSGDQGSTRVNDILHKFPFSLPYSGYIDRGSGATVRQGVEGDWWSQGTNSSTGARHLYTIGNHTSPEYTNYKTYGLAVRCDQGSTRVNDILHKFPFSLPYSGYVNRSTGKAGPFDGGNFWTNAAEGAISTYALSYWSTKVYPARSSASPETDLLKTYGFTVRCVVFCSTGLRPKPPLFLKAIKADFTLGG